MALKSGYDGQSCSLARSLEVVGERWTMLIVRDLFFGVRRFSDLQQHLDIPRAVLSARLAALVERGVVERRPYSASRHEFVLTERGLELWPILHALLRWGDRHFGADGPRKLFAHATCATDLDDAARCPSCGVEPPPGELVMRPAPDVAPSPRTDPVALALREPHRLLEPLELRSA